MGHRSYERKDHLYKKAKAEGFASRAAYKLQELQKKFHLLRPGIRVLDLGAWPGGWIQVALSEVGEQGRIVGIDLVELGGFGQSNVLLLSGDAADTELWARAREFAGGPFDLVLSDMAAKLTGIREADVMAALSCVEIAFAAAEDLLAPGGNLVMKVFPGNEVEQFLRGMRKSFERVSRVGLDSTRRSSNETYVVGLHFLGSSTNRVSPS